MRELLDQLRLYTYEEAGTGIRTVARHFDRREDLLAMCRSCGDLFPGSRLVHIVRHPERVVVSHLDQPWAPDDVDGVCSWLEPIYRRLLRLHETDRLGLPDAETELGFEPQRHTHHRRTLTPAEAAVVRDRLGFVYEPFGYDGRRDILTA